MYMQPAASGPCNMFAAPIHDVAEPSTSFSDLFQELSGLPHASDSNSSDRFSADCEFLLSNVFDLDAALSSLPAAGSDVSQPVAQLHADSACYSCDRSIQNTQGFASGKSLPTTCEPRSFGLLFGPALSTGGTPSMENRPPTASNWHPSSLPPKAVRKGGRSEGRPSLGSCVKGAIIKSQPRHSVTDRVIKPFCIVKSGSRGGGVTLQDLNTSIMEMVAQAGAHTKQHQHQQQQLCPAPGSSLTSWQL